MITTILQRYCNDIATRSLQYEVNHVTYIFPRMEKKFVYLDICIHTYSDSKMLAI